MSESISLSEQMKSLTQASDQLKGLGRQFEGLSKIIERQQKQYAENGNYLIDCKAELGTLLQKSMQATTKPYYFMEQNPYLLSTFDTHIEGFRDQFIADLCNELDKHTYTTRPDLESLREALEILKEYLTINVITKDTYAEKRKFTKWLENKPILTMAGNIVASYLFDFFMDMKFSN